MQDQIIELGQSPGLGAFGEGISFVLLFQVIGSRVEGKEGIIPVRLLSTRHSMQEE